MRILWVLALFLPGSSISAQIKNIPLYPSGISVSWEAVPISEEPEKEKDQPKASKPPKKKWAVLSRPRPTDSSEDEPRDEPKPEPRVEPEPQKVNRLVRVIHAMELPEGLRLGLVFYGENKKILPKATLIVTNTEKPSASQIFFIDRASSRDFVGVADLYFFPKNAAFMSLAVLDKKGNPSHQPSHPGYTEGMIAIQDFLSIEPQNRIMLQFEVTGTPEKSLLRIASFRFGKAR